MLIGMMPTCESSTPTLITSKSYIASLVRGCAVHECSGIYTPHPQKFQILLVCIMLLLGCTCMMLSITPTSREKKSITLRLIRQKSTIFFNFLFLAGYLPAHRSILCVERRLTCSKHTDTRQHWHGCSLQTCGGLVLSGSCYLLPAMCG